MAIVRICQNQPELAVRLVQPGCSGGQLINWEDIRLVIQAPDCGHLLKSPLVVKGCWPGYPGAMRPRDNIRLHELPAVVYPAFETNDKGETVFRFDDHLWKLPAGRYIGLVEFNNGTPIVKLDIDLCTTPFVVDKISTTSISCQAEVCQ